MSRRGCNHDLHKVMSDCKQTWQKNIVQKKETGGHKMELCYDGALVLPSSYAVMDEEEMTYLEGGKEIANLSKKQ